MYDRIRNTSNQSVSYKFTGGGAPQQGVLYPEAGRPWPNGYDEITYGNDGQEIWSTVGREYGDGSLDIGTPYHV